MKVLITSFFLYFACRLARQTKELLSFRGKSKNNICETELNAATSKRGLMMEFLFVHIRSLNIAKIWI